MQELLEKDGGEPNALSRRERWHMDKMNMSFLDTLQGSDFAEHQGGIPIILGLDEKGQVAVKDLTDCIHLVIAGASGTGKSTLLHAILLSILKSSSSDDVKLILCDDKRIELSLYNKFPHLLVPVITDQQKSYGTIMWAHTEMYRRLKLMGDIGARSIDAFNAIVQGKNEPTLPRIVLVIDDAAAVCDRDTKEVLKEIAKNGRTTGFHLILVTQNPSNKYLSEIIKSSIPTRAVFNVFSNEDEKLLLNISKNTFICNVGEIIFFDTLSKAHQRIRCFPISDDIFSTVLSQIKLSDDAESLKYVAETPEGSTEPPSELDQVQQPVKRRWMSKLRDFISSIRTPKSKPACNPIVIATKEELSNFIQEHTLLDEFYTKVVGVTYPNHDGSSRQSILAKCRKGDYIILESFHYQGEPAYAVFTEHGQIGNLSSSLAKNLEIEYRDDIIFSSTISEVTGGHDGLNFGCNIRIRIYQA